MVQKIKEKDWSIDVNPVRMVRYLDFYQHSASDRKMQLFTCAGCRSLWHLLKDDSRQALEIVERCCDSLTGKGEQEIAHQLAVEAEQEAEEQARRTHRGWRWQDSHIADAWAQAAEAISAAARPGKWNTINMPRAETMVIHARDAVGREAASATNGTARERCRAAQLVVKLCEKSFADLLRDIFGNPFRPATLDPAWLTWNDRTVVTLAQAIYDERELPSGHLDTGRLAILGDALEEAGCTNADILSHCRSPGPHVRGCWVVDLLLGKE